MDPNLNLFNKLYVSAQGSDHTKSHKSPLSGISIGLYIYLIWSIEFKSGLKPPCMHITLSFIIATIGKQLKHSVKIFHNLIEYLLLPKILKILHSS